jgi:hypothetical protein
MYRIGAIRVGQMSAWQSLQNNRYNAAVFAQNQATMSAMSDSLYGAQQNKLSGTANLVVQAALARFKTQTLQKLSTLQQASNTISQSASSSASSSPGSVLSLLA